MQPTNTFDKGFRQICVNRNRVQTFAVVVQHIDVHKTRFTGIIPVRGTSRGFIDTPFMRRARVLRLAPKLRIDSYRIVCRPQITASLDIDKIDYIAVVTALDRDTSRTPYPADNDARGKIMVDKHRLFPGLHPRA